MKRVIIFLGIGILISGAVIANEIQAPRIARVLEACNGKISELNLDILEQASEALKVSHPDLAVELKKMADEAVK